METIQPDPNAKPTRAPEHWMLLALASVVAIGFIVLGGFISPDDRGFGTHEKLGLPPCGMMEWTGIPCPGCGVTTSVALAANGRFIDSFINQPFGLLCAFAGAFFALWAFWSHFKGRDLYATVREFRIGRWGLWLSVAMGIAWVYKIAMLA